MNWRIKPIDNYRGFCYAVELERPWDDYWLQANVFYDIREWLYDNKIRNREHSNAMIWYVENKEDALWFVMRWS